MKQWIAPLMLGFGVTLALVVGQRMSTDAMSVVIGVAVGVAASVPTSLLLVALMRKERRTWQGDAPQATTAQQQFPQYQQPQVIMLNPADLLNGRQGQGQLYPPMMVMPPEYAPDAGLRRLRVVGDDD